MIHKKWKRLFAGLLAAVMVVTAIPHSAYAAENTVVESETSESQNGGETSISEETVVEEPLAEAGADTQEIDSTEEQDESGTDIAEKEASAVEREDGGEEAVSENVEKEETQTDAVETLEYEDARTDADEIVEENEVLAANGVAAKLEALKSTYPDGKYWRRVNGVNTVCEEPCPTHANLNTCGYYNNGYQCWAFASKIFNEVFGQNPDLWNSRRYDKENIRVGDYVRFAMSENDSYGHSFVVASILGNGRVTVVENNYGTGRCRIRWGREVDINGTMAIYNQNNQLVNAPFAYYCRARNYDTVNGSTPTLDRQKGTYMSTGYAQVIPDGYYHIASSLGDQWWLTVAGMSNANSANVVLWDYSIRDFDCDEQLFYFQFIDQGGGKGFYKITNKKSGKCLSVANASEYLYDENGNTTNVWQYEDNGNSGQQWAIRSIDGGDKGVLYTFEARCSGYCLDLWNLKTESGANISMCPNNGSLAQQWRLVPYAPAVDRTIEDGEYQIVPKLAENKAIGTAETINGGIIKLSSSYKENAEQIFNVKYLGNGYYSIAHKHSGRYIDVRGGYRVLGGIAWIWEYIDYDAQKWIIKSCGNGYYYIISKCNCLYLNLKGDSVDDGTDVCLKQWNKGDAIKWKFVSAMPKLDPPTPSISSGTEVYPGTTLKFYPVSDGSIYYTCDGTDPRTSATRKNYTAWGIPIETPMTIKAYKVKSGYQDSDVITLTYTVQPKNKLCPPIPDVPSGSVVGADSHVMLDIGDADAVYFTRDGTDPRSSNTRERYRRTITTMDGTYPLGIIIYKTVTIKAYAQKEYYENSDVVEWTYIVGDSSKDPTNPGTPDDDNPPNGLWIKEIEPQTYTGKAVKPKIAVYDHKTLLVEKKDYTVSYKNNVKAGSADGANPPTVIVTGKGNYKGKETQTFAITPKSLADKDITADSITVKYTGKTQKPVPKVTWGSKTLSKKKDYTISYQNEPAAGAYTESGVYTVLVKGVGNYTGERSITVTIIPKDADLPKKTDQKQQLRKARAQLQFDQTASYTGTAVKPSQYTLAITAKDTGGNNSTVFLKEGTDYVVSYQNNIKAGKAFILFQGINNYGGTLKQSYNITPYDMEADTEKKLTITLQDTCPYTKGGCKPEPTVTFAEKTLKKGVDYTISYQNNTCLNDGSSAKKLPTVIIKGRGNFKGTLRKTFTIVPKDIGTLTLTASDKTWQNKNNCYQTKIVIQDTDKKKLSIGGDYSRKVIYEYDTNVTLPDGTTRKAGERVSAQDIIPTRTTIRVTVEACGENYSGTLTGTYRIVKADIGKASVKVLPQTYTGRPVEPDKQQITIKLNGQILSDADYDISCYNNINKGTATMVITGKNDCGGTKTVKFKIKEKGFSWWWRLLKS